jgi:hypothetical protein
VQLGGSVLSCCRVGVEVSEIGGKQGSVDVRYGKWRNALVRL